MRTWLLLGMTALAACGGGNDGGGPNDGNNDDGQAQNDGPCTHVVGSGDGNNAVERITIDTVWTRTGAACDYLIDNVLDVSSGTLTIEPGVVVRFKQDSMIFFDDGGALQANGTAAAHIRFEGLADVDGYADGIFFNAGARESSFDYADFRNLGKQNIAYLEVGGAVGGNGGGGVHITNCTVRKSRIAGMSLGDLAVLELANNAFNDNDGPALRISAFQIPLLDVASDYAGTEIANGRPFVEVDGLSNAAIVENTTWKKLNAPYYVRIALYITGGTSTLQPGVEVVFADGGAFDVQDGATLVTQGTADQHVVFRADGNVAWDGLEFFEAFGNLAYTDIHGADVGIDAIGAFATASVTADHVDFGDSAIGVCVDSESTVSGTNVSIDGGTLIIDESVDQDLYDARC